MIKVSILYPYQEGGRFDFDYYQSRHMARADELFRSAPGYRGYAIERGLGGAAPGSAPAYVAMGHFLFDDAKAFAAAFGPHAAELQGDIPNYTDARPLIQLSEVLLPR
ncbi:ethyl tert-butyl ether degradation protein EthD [Cupriavidus sp. USMAA2-4]|uniref:EthD family reductase n=1 Tax=Cupriavidus sp. USMAA2-4 TaxID=876364 RepID=UPI0008A6BC4E|nr:EthD family reductase [Cupriavidus sp. USMAA2-4]AOY92351.1 ethyl tert-butyl ether degradation protein EthD [Cupriavidus sp. USMAA2-4]